MSENVLETVRRALAEDLGHEDVTTALIVDPAATARAEIMAKMDLVLAGLEAARLTFAVVDPNVSFEATASDGDRIPSGRVVVRLSGSAASILKAERVALNFLMHLSGVATLTSRFVEAARPHRARIVDTRKTMPGLRALEKAAVRSGGGHNHRFGLYDGILIKDNHIAAAGSITQAVRRAKEGAPHTLKVEVEVTSLAGLEEAIQAKADVVLLDNMSPEDMIRAVALNQGRVLLEASGNVTLSSVARIAATGVDIISSGALTHSAPAADLSLNFILGLRA